MNLTYKLSEDKSLATEEIQRFMLENPLSKPLYYWVFHGETIMKRDMDLVKHIERFKYSTWGNTVYRSYLVKELIGSEVPKCIFHEFAIGISLPDGYLIQKDSISLVEEDSSDGFFIINRYGSPGNGSSRYDTLEEAKAAIDKLLLKYDY